MTEPTPPWEPVLEAYLARSGLRVTRQRRAIAEAFFSHQGHPNIDELYATIRAQHPHSQGVLRVEDTPSQKTVLV